MADQSKKRKTLWKISTGDGPELTDNGNGAATALFIKMDDMAQYEKPIIIETDSEYYLDKAAGHAWDKGYELVSPNPEQNLAISEKINKMAGEEIADGHMGPSLDKLEPKNYRPFTSPTADKLPEGFTSEVRVHPVVVRDGTRMTPESPAPDDKVQSWEAVRIFHQKDTSLPAISGEIQQPRITVESQSFGTPEEAIAAAQSMASTSASPEMLKGAIRPELDNGNDQHPRNALLTKLIQQPEVRQEAPTHVTHPEQHKKGISAKYVAEEALHLNALHNDMEYPSNILVDAAIRDLAHRKKAKEEPAVVHNQTAPVVAGQPFPEKKPPDILEKRRHIPAVKDHGNRITITRMGMAYVNPSQKRDRDARVERSLQAARERFGDPVRIEGNRGFEAAVIKAAIAQGIPLEMASKRGLQAYELALQNEKKRGIEKSMGSMSLSKERVKEKNLGKGRGLGLA